MACNVLSYTPSPLMSQTPLAQNRFFVGASGDIGEASTGKGGVGRGCGCLQSGGIDAYYDGDWMACFALIAGNWSLYIANWLL